ncbi:MAG: AmmeMemoRadiSam system protein B [Candidatus Acidiferrales bacterium]
MIRSPAVAGQFYSADRARLGREIDSLLAGAEAPPKQRAIACVVPHAGYVYSGHVAGAVYARIELPKRIVLLGPRHYPRGAAMAIVSDGSWQTPLGAAQLDTELAGELKRLFPPLCEDEVAHQREHSLEVQLPFLQRMIGAENGAFRFTPIVLGPLQYTELAALGGALATAIQASPETVLLVASSDMNHYESDAITRVKDGKAIEKLLARDARGLYDTVRREEISMCGFGPAVTMLTAARLLGATSAELVRYATSGDINGDRTAVVGYAGVIIH